MQDLKRMSSFGRIVSGRSASMLLATLVVAAGIAGGPSVQPASAHSSLGSTCSVLTAWTNHYWSLYFQLECKTGDGKTHVGFHRLGDLASMPDGTIDTKAGARRAGGPYGLKRCRTEILEWNDPRETVALNCAVPLKPLEPRARTCVEIHGDSIDGRATNVHVGMIYTC